MSSERSFPLMTLDEVIVKRIWDKYRLQTLQDGFFGSLWKHGIGGIDEALYALCHPPLYRGEKIAYLERQIELDDEAIENKQGLSPSDRTRHITETPVNPATFFTLREERKQLRLERLKRMEAEGEKLRPAEYVALSWKLANEFVDSVAASLGAFGLALRNNWMLITAGASFTSALYTGYQWVGFAEVYNGVAQEYRESHQVGPYALPVKREIPETLTYVVLNLTHTDQITIGSGDDQVTIPEKHSDPRAAYFQINHMDDVLKGNLGDIVLRSFEGFSDREYYQLAAYRDNAHDNFMAASISLIGEYNTSISYPTQLALAVSGNAAAQNAVGILESHMDKHIVEKENLAYDEMSFWKWFTIGLCGVGGIMVYSSFRNSQHRSSRSRYYDY